MTIDEWKAREQQIDNDAQAAHRQNALDWLYSNKKYNRGDILMKMTGYGTPFIVEKISIMRAPKGFSVPIAAYYEGRKVDEKTLEPLSDTINNYIGTFEEYTRLIKRHD
jgi:hypothetical protein